MICVSLADLEFEHCLEVLDRVEFAEIRMDRLDFSPSQFGKIFFAYDNLIATYRPGGKDEEERQEALLKAIRMGVTYVDIEVESPEDFRRPLIEAAEQLYCKVIVSYHNYELTPSKKELLSIVGKCFAYGGHIAKIACRVDDYSDAARLLSLYDRDPDADGELIALGMGELGKITRVAAPLLGAPFTFAALERGRETAPGQLDKDTLQGLLESIGCDE